MDHSHGIKIQFWSNFLNDLVSFWSSPKWANFGEIQSSRTESQNHYVHHLDTSDSSEEGWSAVEEGQRWPARWSLHWGSNDQRGGRDMLLCCDRRRVSAAAPPFVLQLHFAPEGAKEDDSEEQMPERRSGRGGVEQLHRWWWWLPPLGTGGTARIVCGFWGFRVLSAGLGTLASTRPPEVCSWAALAISVFFFLRSSYY